jgi:hypothetical protein
MVAKLWVEILRGVRRVLAGSLFFSINRVGPIRESEYGSLKDLKPFLILSLLSLMGSNCLPDVFTADKTPMLKIPILLKREPQTVHQQW